MRLAEKIHQLICFSPLTKQEEAAFNEIINYRNRVIHFHFEQDNNMGSDIASKQFHAWYFIHQLLQNKWIGIFKNWSLRIESINQELKRIKDYLQDMGNDIGNCSECNGDQTIVLSENNENLAS